MRGELTDTRPIRGECEVGQPRKGVGLVRISLFSREAAGLFAVGLSVLAWFTDVDSLGQEPRVFLVHGEPDVQILSFVQSPDGTKLATTDAAGRVALRDLRSGWVIPRS